MSESSHVHTIRLPLRRISAALPAVALISAGIMLPSSAASTAASRLGLASQSSPAIVVPDTPITLPSSSQSQDDPRSARSAGSAEAPVAQPLATILPAGTLPGSSTPVTLDSTGIPVRALQAYRQAATLIGSADPSCHLDWALLGAIGRVESDHARYGGNQLDAAGVAQPGIIGIPLDGSNGTARVLDTDHGLLDRDTTYDRAVGPMQFIPSTWRFAGVDANGDGVKDPQNMADSAAATAVYLCSGSGDLLRPADLRSAILRYNPSDSYASMVIAIADAYRHGVRALPASDVAPVKLTTAKSRTSGAAGHAKVTAGKPVAHLPGSTPAKTTAAKPTVTPQAPATSIPAATQVPPKTLPGSPQPTPSTTPTPTSTSPSPTTTCVPVPSTTSTTSTSTSTPDSASSPTPTVTCLPPCAPTASGTSTASPTSSTASPTSPPTCLPPCAPTASPTSSAASATPAQPCLTSAPSTPSTTTTP